MSKVRVSLDLDIGLGPEETKIMVSYIIECGLLNLGRPIEQIKEEFPNIRLEKFSVTYTASEIKGES
jgi:hypothetical protein